MRIIRMILQCQTPLHCGGGPEDMLQDQPVARDAFGVWRIPGSSLAGLLRHLAESLNASMARQLFGEQEGTESRPSLVWCSDATLLDFDHVPAASKVLAGQKIRIPLEPYVRDHVRIDLSKGSAEDGGKFDAEIVPAGARFAVQVVLDGWNRKLAAEEEHFFDTLCGLLAQGALALGGKRGHLGYAEYFVQEPSGMLTLSCARLTGVRR